MNKRNWLITGSFSGLGKAMTETVIDSGDYVIGTFRKESEINQFNTTYGDKAKGVLLVITDIGWIDSMVQELLNEHGQIDVLVNNADVGFAGAIEEASIKEVREVFEPNFFGTLRLTQAILPQMRRRRNGQIIQISSHAGIKAFSGFGIFNASKFALEGFSEALAQEVNPLGIKVTIVEPGPFRTNFAGSSLRQAALTISDYDDTAGAFRNKLLSVHNKQEGDPDKAAEIILKHIDNNESTLKLALGTIPIKSISMKIESLKSDLEKNREISMKVIYS